MDENSGETPTEFAKHLYDGISNALDVAGLQSIRELIAPLLTHAGERVRGVACIAAVELMYGDDRCLSDAARSDPVHTPEARRRRVSHEVSVPPTLADPTIAATMP
jgi:hypothetical protein